MQNVTSDLANGLMAAESAATFLRARNDRTDWQTIASIKAEVDRLSGCDLIKATELADRLDQLSRLIGDPLSHAFARAGRARVLDNMGRHAEANELYESAAAAMQSSGLKIEAAIIRKQQLHALIQLGRYNNALRTASTARRVLSRADPVQLAQLEANIGNIYYRLDRYRKALSHYDRARAALSEQGDETMLAVIDFSRSSVLAELDQPNKALDLLQNAAAKFDRAGRSLQAEQCRFHISYLQFLRGNYNDALSGYHRVRDRVSELGSDELGAYCSLNIAHLLLTLNAFEDSVEHAQTARETFERLRMPFESARSHLISGLTAMGLRQYDPARTAFMNAREAFNNCGNVIFTALVDSYLAELAGKTGDPDEMTGRARASLRVFSRNRLPSRAAWSRLLMARAAYEIHDWSRARRLAMKTLETIDGIVAPGIAYQCYHLIGRIQRDQNRPKLALQSFRRAVGEVEQMREWIVADEFKARFLEDKTQVYDDAIAASLNDGATVAEAFRLVESSKSRALAEILARYSTGSRQSADSPPISSTRQAIFNLTEDLNWYLSQCRLEEEKGKQRNESMLERYRSAAYRCERQIKQLFNRIESETRFADMDQVHPVGEADLRNSLREQESLVEFFADSGKLSAFIVSRDGIRVLRSITSLRQVEPLLTALRFQIEKFTYDPAYPTAHREQLSEATNKYLERLYLELFAPIESSLAGKRLVIVPHGVLHYLPFHALYDGNQYLIDRLEISYAPSASVFALCRARSSLPRTTEPLHDAAGSCEIVAVGVSDRDAPHIEEEVRSVGALFHDSVALIGKDATRENLQRFAPGARFLHLASHGFFRRDNPMFSFLNLADGRLNFYSLADLRLRAEMVTLSACQTGLNALLPGDELHGLMRGVLYAGAHAVTASLWKVGDRSTAELMSMMYANIRDGQSKSSALRNAQLAVKSTYGHPYYWAPFVLMGSPD